MKRGTVVKRILLDTNIFGLIVVDNDRDQVVQDINRCRKIKVCASRITRNELRDTPKKVKIGTEKLRSRLLGIYDLIVRQTFESSPEIEQLAVKYYQIYREIGGVKSKTGMINDLLIVATASLHQLDIISTNDEKTMMGEIAAKAYEMVNHIEGYTTPRFINYEEFKKMIKRSL